jgi:hypothetical protein
MTEDATSSPKVSRFLDSSSDWGNGWANIVVYGPYIGVEGDLESLGEQQRDALRADFEGKIEDSPPRQIDGVAALGLHLVRPRTKGHFTVEGVAGV